MPMLISTKEQWFRKEKRDIWKLDFDLPYEQYQKLGDKKVQKMYKDEMGELNAWIEANQPQVKWHVFGPSEYSGYMMGGPSYNVAEMTDDEVAQFNTKWCAHPYWRLERQRYSDWRTFLDSFEVWNESDAIPFKSNWFDVPGIGIVVLHKVAECSFNEDSPILSTSDAIYRINELYATSTSPQESCQYHGIAFLEKIRFTALLKPMVYEGDDFGERFDLEEAYVANPDNKTRIVEAYGLKESGITVKFVRDDW